MGITQLEKVMEMRVLTEDELARFSRFVSACLDMEGLILSMARKAQQDAIRFGHLENALKEMTNKLHDERKSREGR